MSKKIKSIPLEEAGGDGKMPRAKKTYGGPFGDDAEKLQLAETTINDKNRRVRQFVEWRSIQGYEGKPDMSQLRLFLTQIAKSGSTKTRQVQSSIIQWMIWKPQEWKNIHELSLAQISDLRREINRQTSSEEASTEPPVVIPAGFRWSSLKTPQLEYLALWVNLGVRSSAMLTLRQQDIKVDREREQMTIHIVKDKVRSVENRKVTLKCGCA